MGKGEDRGLWLSGSFTVKSARQSHKVIHQHAWLSLFSSLMLKTASVAQGKIPRESGKETQLGNDGDVHMLTIAEAKGPEMYVEFPECGEE